jgi:1,2-diacylglycerol 3-alpha-glucosyltransferase
MRIVIAAQNYLPNLNGAAVFATNLAEGLAERNHQVVAIVPSDRNHSYRTEQHHVRIQRIRALPLSPKVPDVRITYFSDAEVGRILSEFKPHIVHIQDHYPLCRSVMRKARDLHLPVIATNHFLPGNILLHVPFLQPITKVLSRLLWKMLLDVFNQANIVTTPTETAASILREQKIQVEVRAISCGVNLERFFPDNQVDRIEERKSHGLDPEKLLYLYLGRVDRDKGVNLLPPLFKELPRDDIQLAIAGKGSYLSTLRSRVKTNGHNGKVVFLGFIPDDELPALFNSADVFIMPSRIELQSIATLEAMATGLPVVAANAGALPELVEDNVNGYLFRPEDKDDASRVVNLMSEYPQQRSSMKSASLLKVRKHDIHKTLLQYENLYREIAGLS